MKQLVLLLAALHFFFATGCAREPSNYEDCILKNVRASMEKGAVNVVTQACRNKFPIQADYVEPPTDLPADAIDKLGGKFRISKSGGFGNMYNGNENWRLKEVTIAVAEPDWAKKWLAKRRSEPQAKEPLIEYYRIDLSVAPLTNRDFFISLNWDTEDEYIWFISEAKGFPIVSP